MLKTRPMRFRNPPRQIKAPGIAKAVWPEKRLMSQFITRFLGSSLKRLWNSHRPNNLRPFLQKADIAEATISLDEFLNVPPRLPRFEWTLECMTELERSAADSADDDGASSDLNLDDAIDEALSDITRRARAFLDTLRCDYGPEAAAWGLQHVRDCFQKEYERVRGQLPRWSPEDTQDLLQATRILRSATNPPRWHWKLVTRLWPQIPPTLWLTKAQQSTIRRRAVPAITRAAGLRSDVAVADAKLELFERLLGRPGVPGRLDELLQELREYMRMIHDLIASCNEPPPEDHSDAILLAESIDDEIDPSKGLRLRHVFDDMARRVGCTPQDFADKLQREGVSIDDTRRRPSEWSECDPVNLVHALQVAVHDYLGFRGWDARPCIDRPRTAIEAIASITLSSPFVRPLLERSLPDLARRSRPHATFQSIAGAQPRTHAFLICYPTQRKYFERLLLVYANLANRAASGSDVPRTYQVNSPNVVILLQYAIAGPGGAQTDLQRGMREMNRLLARDKITPLFDENHDLPEVRLLPERPDDDYDDASQLFSAARRAHAVVPVATGNDRYNLLKTEPRLRGLFASDLFDAAWKPAGFFLGQLKTGAFVDFVQAIHPALVDWLSIVQQLRTDFDATRACRQLVEHGILEANPHGLYCIKVLPPASHMRIPYGLYSRRPGPVSGLSADGFVSQLLRNDWLYNTVFWQVVDALDQERICPSDVPTFMVEYLQNLQ